MCQQISYSNTISPNTETYRFDIRLDLQSLPSCVHIMSVSWDLHQSSYGNTAYMVTLLCSTATTWEVPKMFAII